MNRIETRALIERFLHTFKTYHFVQHAYESREWLRQDDEAPPERDPGESTVRDALALSLYDAEAQVTALTATLEGERARSEAGWAKASDRLARVEALTADLEKEKSRSDKRQHARLIAEMTVTHLTATLEKVRAATVAHVKEQVPFSQTFRAIVDALATSGAPDAGERLDKHSEKALVEVRELLGKPTPPEPKLTHLNIGQRSAIEVMQKPPTLAPPEPKVRTSARHVSEGYGRSKEDIAAECGVRRPGFTSPARSCTPPEPKGPEHAIYYTDEEAIDAGDLTTPLTDVGPLLSWVNDDPKGTEQYAVSESAYCALRDDLAAANAREQEWKAERRLFCDNAHSMSIRLTEANARAEKAEAMSVQARMALKEDGEMQEKLDAAEARIAGLEAECDRTQALRQSLDIKEALCCELYGKIDREKARIADLEAGISGPYITKAAWQDLLDREKARADAAERSWVIADRCCNEVRDERDQLAARVRELEALLKPPASPSES